MAVTYATDLNLLADAELVTGWAELTNYAGGGTNVIDAENFIQGANCISQVCGNKTGLDFSVAYNNGSPISWTTGWVFLIWHYFAVPEALYSQAGGGAQIAVFSSLTVGDLYEYGGKDFGRNPYGGWDNIAVDPEIAGDTQDGGGNGGSYQYIGAIVGLSVKVSKGNPHACDAIRYGRGEIYCTGDTPDANFTDMAIQNDDNVTNNYRWGLFSNQKGFIWKGLMSLGQAGTAVVFSDSNKSIKIENTEKVYASFNRIEINHVDTEVTWINISFEALGTVSKGEFEMIDNAAVMDWTGCIFNQMSTFVFLSNAVLLNCVWNGCGLVTQGGASITGCTFEGSIASASLLSADMSAVGNSFISDGSNHALELSSIGGGSMIWDNLLSGYETGALGSPVTPGSTGNEAIYVNVATASDLTINVEAGATIPSIRVGASFTGDVNVVAGAVTLTINVEDEAGDPITDAQTSIYLEASPFTELMNEDTVGGVATESYSGSTPVSVVVKVRKSDSLDTPRYFAYSSIQEIGTDGLTLTVTLEVNPFI